jgi:predicted thioredoxin/glutaredoxin
VSELAEAQGELSITHGFSERQIYMNRNIMSMYIELMNEQLIHGFMDSYAQMATLADELQIELDTLEQNNNCVDRIRNRFALQIQRYGTFLSGCIRQSHTEIQRWSVHTDELHETAHLSLNQAQNLGLVSLTQRTDFANTNSFYPAINRLLRILLASTRSYMDAFEDFRRSVVDSEEEILEELTRCDRDLVNQFTASINRELYWARRCPPNVTERQK